MAQWSSGLWTPESNPTVFSRLSNRRNILVRNGVMKDGVSKWTNWQMTAVRRGAIAVPYWFGAGTPGLPAAPISTCFSTLLTYDLPHQKNCRDALSDDFFFFPSHRPCGIDAGLFEYTTARYCAPTESIRINLSTPNLVFFPSSCLYGASPLLSTSYPCVSSCLQ